MTRRSESGRQETARHAGAASAPAPLGTARPGTGSRTAADRGLPRPSLTVRRATLGDLPTVVELRLSLLRENADHPVYGHLRADARERAYDIFGTQLRSPHEVMLLAEKLVLVFPRADGMRVHGIGPVSCAQCHKRQRG